MRILREPLDLIDARDIHQLCIDQVSEGTEVELKSDLPFKGSKGTRDPWHTGGSVGDYARNQIAEEIIAFANTLGGVVCVGINETQDHPKRAASPNALPRVHELARRLRQAIYDVVDPPLPVLEAVGIELNPGEGVVLIRTPPSRRRPHRHGVSKEVFVRRADESARISMREIQELTIQSVAEATRVEQLIEARREKFIMDTSDWHQRQRVDNRMWGGGLHFLGIPTTSIDLGRVAGHPGVLPHQPPVFAVFKNDQRIQCSWPHARNLDWRPGLRSISAQSTFSVLQAALPDRETTYSLKTDGTFEVSYKFRATDEFPGLYVSWLVGLLGMLLSWIEQIRHESGIAAEYALAAELCVVDRPVLFVEYGVSSVAESHGHTLPGGNYILPVMSIGPRDEFPVHIARFDEDLWNIAGKDFRSSAPTFELQL